MLSIVATDRRTLARDPELLDLVFTLYAVGEHQEYAGFERKSWLE